jgi:hypothetical protein
MCTPRRSIRKALFAVLGLALFAVSVPAFADDDPPDRVARLSFMSGDVSFQPSGEDDWVQANLNRPLGTGDRLFTDNASRVEMEVGAATLRLDAQSSFDILNLNDNVAQTELTQGVMNLHVRRVFEGQSYEVDTPNLAFVIKQPGDYRVDIAPDGSSTMITVFGGAGDVYGENNASYSVRSGQSYRFHDAALQDYEVLDLPRGDDFDNWVDTRNNRYQKSVSRQYVSEDVIGYADLDDYGGWNDEPQYGHVWYPTNVETGWAPYRSGHWSWIDPWGWTWVDNAAWGFAPFHYGRWVYASNRWGWCPGQFAARPIYAPALVGFVGGAGWGIGINTGGPVGWFPLGPRDVYVPWYHSSRNYFTNVNVRNTTIINNTNITNVYNNYSRGQPINNANYAYRQNTAAVTAVSRETFVGARAVNTGRVQVNEGQLRNANVVSRVGIAPQRASFVAADAARARAVPTAQTLNRSVIARTAPPPRPVPVAARITAIERNGSQPLATQQMRQIAARPGTAVAVGAAAGAGAGAAANRGAQQRVQVVGQNGPKPQPLPARAPGRAVGTAPGTAQTLPTRGPVTTPVNPNVHAPGTPANQTVHAPGTPANPNARIATPPTREQAATPARGEKPTGAQQTTGNGLPSSRFAPHTGQPPRTTGETVSGTPATKPLNVRTTPANERATVNRQTQSPSTNASGTERRTTTTTTPPTRTAPSDNNVPRSHTQSTTTSAEQQRRATTQQNTNGSPRATTQVQKPTQTPREYTPRTAPQTYKAPQQQQQQQQQRSPPPQVERTAPPSQSQRTAPVQQQRQAPPPPQGRAPPPPKEKASDKKKDDDNGGH